MSADHGAAAPKARGGVLIARDTREQRGFLVDEFPAETVVIERTMPTADYTAAMPDGRLLSGRLLVERKTTSDLLGCIGRERERFENELVRMAGSTQTGILLIEDITWERLYAGRWPCPSQLSASHVRGSLAAWTQRFLLHVVPAGTRAAAARILWDHCRRALWDELKALAQEKSGRGSDETRAAAAQVIPGEAPATTPTGLRQ